MDSIDKRLQRKEIETDVLIIGGGTAGCYAALTFSKNSRLNVLIAEKANIKRSGCLAAGVNAINAYITEGREPKDYVDYAKKDANGIVRNDLLLTAAERFNKATEEMEKLGLVILKDADGKYVARGDRNIKINGENFKPILAEAVNKADNVSVLNNVNITDLLVKDGRVYGAVGFSISENSAYIIKAKSVLIATGGAAGLYRPNNPGFSRHKMWYPPFNTGAGYAMGIRAGAEMTSFEMRFIALRCKDTIAPTGTIAQGVRAKQINSKGDVYENKYGITTSERVYGTVRENQLGNGPCYLQTSVISKDKDDELLKAYLNMAPSQTLKWIESGRNPSEADVEIEGTEPYIVGGHTASGFWVNTNRETTIHGLYAAGDVAGGCPQKYVTGALAEGEIAALDIIAKYGELLSEKADNEKNVNIDASETEDNKKGTNKKVSEIEDNKKDTNKQASGMEDSKKDVKKHASEIEDIKKCINKTVSENTDFIKDINKQADDIISAYENFLYKYNESKENLNESLDYSVEYLEEAMQKVMDEYAGGISTNYQYNEKQLKLADDKIDILISLSEKLGASDMHELMFVYELRERLTVCKALIAHLLNRKETRWHSFNENLDYPNEDKDFCKYVNSRFENGRFKIILRDIIEEEVYEHQD